MKIISSNKQSLGDVISVLKKGGTVVYPTDTAYALGGRFNSRPALNKIMKIKGRSDNKFTLIASSLYQVKKYFKLNPVELILAKQYWPGPLSLAVSGKFAVRVPDNDVARLIARRIGAPLIATSANISGSATPYSIKTILSQFKGKQHLPDIVIDGGTLPKTKTSTIVEAKRDTIRLIRPGSISIIK